MGGKRPDQYQIAPSEGGSTDYKRYPETTHGQDQDLNTTGDKQRLAQSEQNAMNDMAADRPGGSPFPPETPAPSIDARHGRKLDEDNEDNGAENSDSGRENPSV